MTSLGLDDRETNDDRQYQTRYADDEKRLSPADVLRDPPAEQVSQHDAGRNTDRVNAHGGRALLGRIEIGDH